MRGRTSVSFSALVVTMIAFGSAPASACDWGWSGCGCGYGYGYGYYDAPTYYAPPAYAYYEVPPAYYTPPVYYVPPVNGYGIYRPYAGGDYGEPRYSAQGPYYGMRTEEIGYLLEF